MRRPVQMGRCPGGVQIVVRRHHQHFPYRQSGAYDVGLTAGSGVTELHGDSYAMYGSFVIAALGFQLRWLHAVVWLAWIYLQLPFHATRAFGYFTFFTGGISLVLIALAWQQRPQENSLVAKPLRLLALWLAAVE